MGSHETAERVCRPFDVTRNGIVVGEGSAFLILESAEAAAARGAAVLARLAGWTLSLDNCGRTGVDHKGSALLQTMQQALRLAEISPDHVDYINAHGTGTKLNDAAEARSVKTLFGENGKSVPCSSTKPITGHCLALRRCWRPPQHPGVASSDHSADGELPFAGSRLRDQRSASHAAPGATLDRDVKLARLLGLPRVTHLFQKQPHG